MVDLWKHRYLLEANLFLLFISIVCLIIPGVTYLRLIRESENLATTEDKNLKRMKLKFINYYQLNGKVANTEVFADRYIRKLKWGPTHLDGFSHLAGQAMLLSVFLNGLFVCISLAAGNTLFQIIPYYGLTLLCLYVYFSVSGIVNLSGKKKTLKLDLVDYLENHLLPRLDAEKKETALKAEDAATAFAPIKEPDTADSLYTAAAPKTAEEAEAEFQELESLLTELLA